MSRFVPRVFTSLCHEVHPEIRNSEPKMLTLLVDTDAGATL